ncbi:MAG: SGNH/GDSL hydrolase family protein [Candidatus Hydrogenedentes bacterium]|nr:SGNH/GDSL hydrolase family protein [Candidatus Hydrogenedentota bacterium]
MYVRCLLLPALMLVVLGTAAAQEAPDVRRIDPDMAIAAAGDDLQWYDAQLLGVEGRGWKEVAAPYDRLPSKAEGVVPDPVWSLSHHSAGMAIRFQTNARRINAKWKLRFENLAMPHMPATGVSGVDLYLLDGGAWRWAAGGRPTEFPENSVELLADAPEGVHEYLLYLPLYNGVEPVLIGIESGAELTTAPARPEASAKPILFYGTSITQGGCASRPGMAYPALIGRRLHRETINLGFSGNGRMEPAMAGLLGELDPAVYVLDCLPNLKPGESQERVAPFVRALRAARPDTPILLVEHIIYQHGWIDAERGSRYQQNNENLKAAYQALKDEGISGLHYLPCDALLGDDGEATVDGVHPTDLGFHRQAIAIGDALAEILK